MSSFPIHGQFTLDSRGHAKWAGKWAMSLDDLHSGDDHKRSPFEYQGVPARAPPTSSSSSSSTSNPTNPAPPTTTDGTGAPPAPAAAATAPQEQVPVVINGITVPTQWKGRMKMRQGQKSVEVREEIDLFQLTPTPEQPNSYHVMIRGDNRLGQFEAAGTCIMNLDTMSGPMKLIKRYTQFWDKKEHKRPVRKRAPSSTLSDAERQEAKRRKVDKTLKSLVGSGGVRPISSSSSTATGSSSRYVGCGCVLVGMLMLVFRCAH
jgi:hypothetical protein